MAHFTIARPAVMKIVAAKFPSKSEDGGATAESRGVHGGGISKLGRWAVECVCARVVAVALTSPPLQ